MHKARWKYRTPNCRKKIAICEPSQKFVRLRLRKWGMYRQSEKCIKWQYFLHMSSQYGELQPTNGWYVLASLGHPSKFQRVSRIGFVSAPTSLSGDQLNFARWLAFSCAGIYIYILGAFAPNGILPAASLASKSCVLLYWQRYCTSLEQWASAKVCGVVQGVELRNFRRRRHLYSTERPSRWASAHF